jgi:hypothetical protein
MPLQPVVRLLASDFDHSTSHVFMPFGAIRRFIAVSYLPKTDLSEQILVKPIFEPRLTSPSIMKKSLPFLFVVAFAGNILAQNCVRDSSLLMSGALLSPAYWDTVTMQYNLNDACIGVAYNQYVTVNVPATYEMFPLVSVSVATTGAITDLPAGLTYSCDPPNCVFNAQTLGCIRIFGTPTTGNLIVPDTFDLGITTSILTSSFPFPIPLTFPSGLPGNNHYYLALKDAQCLVGTYDQNTSIGYVKNAPNPFSAETNISIESRTNGDFQFEVFNLLGSRVHHRTVRLEEGMNTVVFDGSQLPNGSYFYTIGNREGKVSRRLVIAR